MSHFEKYFFQVLSCVVPTFSKVMPQ